MWLYSKHDNQLSYLSNISTYVRRGGFYQHHNMYNWGMQVSIPVSIWGTMETTFSHQKDELGQSDNQNQLEQTGDIFSAEKSDFRGMERLWCVQQRRCIPRKMGCPRERRRGEAGDDPRTATARTGPRVPHGQRAGEPGQHGEQSLGQTFSGFGHHNHHHHWYFHHNDYYHCHNQNRNHQEPWS